MSKISLIHTFQDKCFMKIMKDTGEPTFIEGMKHVNATIGSRVIKFMWRLKVLFYKSYTKESQLGGFFPI